MRSLSWFPLICSNDTWEGGKRDENDITAKGSKSNPESFLTPSRWCVYVYVAAKSSHQDVPFQTFQIVDENYYGGQSQRGKASTLICSNAEVINFSFLTTLYQTTMFCQKIQNLEDFWHEKLRISMCLIFYESLLFGQKLNFWYSV